MTSAGRNYHSARHFVCQFIPRESSTALGKEPTARVAVHGYAWPLGPGSRHVGKGLTKTFVGLQTFSIRNCRVKLASWNSFVCKRCRNFTAASPRT